MKQVPQPEELTPNWPENVPQAQLAALLDGLLAVCRARERGEPWWALDVRRAQARIAALRLGPARTIRPHG